MSVFKFLEAEDWNALMTRLEALEGAGITLSDNIPADMPTTGTAGIGTEASRDDHIHPTIYTCWMNMREFEGAIWNYTTGERWIQLDANTERVILNGVIPKEYNRYWIRIWYMNPASSNTGLLITISDGAAFEGRVSNVRENNDAPELYHGGSSSFDWVYYEYGPYTITDDSDSVLVNCQIYRNTADLNVFGGEIVADTESS